MGHKQRSFSSQEDQPGLLHCLNGSALQLLPVFPSHPCPASADSKKSKSKLASAPTQRPWISCFDPMSPCSDEAKQGMTCLLQVPASGPCTGRCRACHYTRAAMQQQTLMLIIGCCCCCCCAAASMWYRRAASCDHAKIQSTAIPLVVSVLATMTRPK